MEQCKKCENNGKNNLLCAICMGNNGEIPHVNEVGL